MQLTSKSFSYQLLEDKTDRQTDRQREKWNRTEEERDACFSPPTFPALPVLPALPTLRITSPDEPDESDKSRSASFISYSEVKNSYRTRQIVVRFG